MAQSRALLMDRYRRALPRMAQGPLRNEQSRQPSDRLEAAAQLQKAELSLENAELRRALLALEARAERERECFDLCPLPYLTLNARGEIVEANVEATELLEMPRLALLGRTFHSFLSPADAERMHRFRSSGLGSHEPHSLDVQVRCGKGRNVAVAVHARAKPMYSGCPGGCRVVLVPATKQSRLSRLGPPPSAEASHSGAQRGGQMLYAATNTGKVCWHSPVNEQLWQQAVHSDLSTHGNWLQSVHPGDRLRVAEARRRLLAGTPLHEEYRIELLDGGVRWVSEQACAMGGARLPIVGVVRDAMHESEQEQELNHYRKQESVESLAAGVAHDLGNVFQGITGCLELAAQQPELGSAKLGLVQEARSAAWRGAQLVGKLLGFSRKTPTRLDCVDCCDVVRELKPLLARLVCEDVRLETHFGVKSAPVVADALQIEQMLLNLAANARDAMPLGGKLLIEVDQVASGRDLNPVPGTAVRLRVTDTGCGMDEPTRRRAVEPFFTTKGIGEGTGLGLSTVSAVARSLGGAVRLESVVGEGSRITIELPKGHFVASKLSSNSEERILSGRVLIVDDDRLIRSTLAAQLKGFGLEVLEAESAGMALTLDLEGFDLLLSDVTMPGMSGPGLARLLTARWPALEVLYMSATPLRELVRRGQLADDADFLDKPFDPHQLVARLRLLLPPECLTRTGTFRVPQPAASSWGSR